MGKHFTVGEYLLERLVQIGVKSVFGVPGDFNLGFLDFVENHPNLDWIGNCNELNASYAADGYARVKKGSVGALITTFGVGELSAINGIAGAFSEHIPIVHIVGVPSTSQQKNKPMLHHTLGDGRYDAYYKASQQFTVASANLQDAATAPGEIDRVLQACITAARPVYIMLPTDLAFSPADAAKSALETPLKPNPPAAAPDVEDFAIGEITRLVKDAGEDVVVLVDACAVRHDVEAELKDFVKTTNFPVYAAPMGKTVIPEDYERYGGIYIGSISHPDTKEAVESAKLIISVGGVKSDFNTGNFTYRIPTVRTVELHSDHTLIQHALYQDMGMKSLLPKLTTALKSVHSSAKSTSIKRSFSQLPAPGADPLGPDVISQLYLWPRVSQFLQPKDIIVAETGTSSFGILDVPLPNESILVAQILWGSIGYATGSTLGAALAARETNMGRTILFTGDGSIQLTVQELATMMRRDLHPIIFVLNNDGYTIERWLHGKEAKYNDISSWNWTGILDVLGPHIEPKPKSHRVTTKAELDALLSDPEFNKAERMQLVEVIMDKFDAPEALQRQAELSGKTNAYVSEYL